MANRARTHLKVLSLTGKNVHISRIKGVKVEFPEGSVTHRGVACGLSVSELATGTLSESKSFLNGAL